MVNHFLLHINNPSIKSSSLCIVHYLLSSRLIVLLRSLCAMELYSEDIQNGIALEKMFAAIDISVMDLGHGLNFLLSRCYEQAECELS